MKEIDYIGHLKRPAVSPIQLVLHTGDVDITPLAVLAFDIESDYIKNWTDYILCEVSVTLSVYTEIIKKASDTIMEATVLNGPHGDYRYRAIISPTNDLPNKDVLDNISVADLNQSLMSLSLQLVNISAEFMSTVTVGGVYSGLTVTDLLRSVLNEAIDKNGTNYPIDELEVVEGDNKDEVTQHVIPSVTPVLKIPKSLQKEDMGVYSGGINMYLYHRNKKSRVRVYPPATNNWEKTAPNLRIVAWDLFNVNQNYKHNTYGAYPVGGEQVHIIVSKDPKDPAVRERRNVVRSTSFHGVSADQMMDGYISVNPKSLTTNASRVDVKLTVGDRSDDYHPFTSNSLGITDNMYDMLSALRINRSETMTLIWQNSLPGLLYPGMPIKVNSQVSDGFEERYGSLIYAYTSHTRTSGLRADTTKVLTYLTVLLDKEN